MPSQFDTLLKAAKKAKENAYAPYSRFLVGAAVLSKSGKVFAGCNVENASYGLTLCAERNAIFKMISEGEREIDQILVLGNTKDPLPPCGACRQVILEFASLETKVFMCNKKGDVDETTVGELLPYPFTLKEDSFDQL